jgi:hypothetical protein
MARSKNIAAQKGAHPTTSVKRTMKAVKTLKRKQDVVPLVKGSNRKAVDTAPVAAVEQDDEDEKKTRVVRNGTHRRAIQRTNNMIENVVSTAGYRRMVKGLLTHFATTNTILRRPGFTKPTKGYKNGMSFKGHAINADPDLNNVTFGSFALPTLQTSAENDLMKVVEHAQQSRFEGLTPNELKKAQGKKVQIKSTQLQGAYYRYWAMKHPKVNDYFRAICFALGKRCTFPRETRVAA